MLISTIIALLISLNFIVSEADFNSKSQQEKDALIEIVITDIPVM